MRQSASRPKSLVEAQLSKVASLTAEEYEAVEASAKAGFLVSGTTAHGDTDSAPGVAAAHDEKKRGKNSWRLSLAGAAIVGLAGLDTLMGKDPKAAQAQPEIAPVAAAPAVPTAPRNRRLLA